jgi:hypothetical protein
MRGFPSAHVHQRVMLLHVGLGYSPRETTVQAKLANWPPSSNVALLKRFRNSGTWAAFSLQRVSLLEQALAAKPAAGGKGWRQFTPQRPLVIRGKFRNSRL